MIFPIIPAPSFERAEMLSNLNLTHLSNFIQIVEWRSISKAAAFLHIAQPALSRQVRLLEDAFGAKLLRRHAWGVEPTEDGELILEHARRIQREWIAAREGVQMNKENPTGSVFLGVPSAYAVTLVPPLLQRMRAAYPNLRVRVIEAFSGTIYEWLIAGRLDMAVLYHSKEYDAAQTTPFIEEDLAVLGSVASLAGKTEMHLSELSDRQLIAPWRPHMLRLTLETAFISCDLTFEPSIEIDSLPVMKELAHRGAGYAVLPPSSVERELKTGRLARVGLSPDIRLSTVLGKLPGRQPTRAVRLVSDELKKLATELAPQTGWDASKIKMTGGRAG